MHDVRLLIFDWDGTLMDSAKRIGECFSGAARAIGLPPPRHETVRQYIGLDLAEVWVRLYADLDETTIDRLVTGYREHWLVHNRTPMPLFDGVEAGLARLVEQGFWLAVATGKSRAGLDRAMAACELRATFVCTRCADESRSKPHPQMLLDILEFTGADERRALMIGDTTFDMEMAAGAGVEGAAVGYGSHSPAMLQPQSRYPVAATFSELVEMILDD